MQLVHILNVLSLNTLPLLYFLNITSSVSTSQTQTGSLHFHSAGLQCDKLRLDKDFLLQTATENPKKGTFLSFPVFLDITSFLFRLLSSPVLFSEFSCLYPEYSARAQSVMPSMTSSQPEHRRSHSLSGWFLHPVWRNAWKNQSLYEVLLLFFIFQFDFLPSEGMWRALICI